MSLNLLMAQDAAAPAEGDAVAIADAPAPRKCFKDENEDGICDKSQRAGGKCDKNCVDQEAYQNAQGGDAQAPAEDEQASPALSMCAACPNAGNCSGCPLAQLKQHSHHLA